MGFTIFFAMNKKLPFIALAFLLGMSQSWAVDPRIEQGARFEAKGQYDKALGEYRAMLAENKKNTEAYMAAGKVRMKMKDYKGAVANFRLAYGYDPSLTEAYEGAAKAYEAMGQQAKADAERAKIKGAKTASAAPAATAAKTETPKAEPAKVETKVAQPAQTAPAKTEAPKAAQPATSPATQIAAAEDPFEKGKALLAEGRYAEAAPLWRTVLSKKPGDAGAYFYAGLTRYEMGEYDKAEFNLKKGLSYKERGNDANYYLAKINQKGKRLDQEKKYLTAYLKKAAPDAKFRKAAEDRMAEINAAANAAAEEKAMKEAEAQAMKDAKKTGNDKAKSAEVSAPQKEDVAPTATNSIANANALYADGYNEAALQMYKALLENEITPDERYFAMLQMGNIYREMRDFHSAVTRYRDVVREFPDSDWATEAERALEDAVWLEKHASELPRNKR